MTYKTSILMSAYRLMLVELECKAYWVIKKLDFDLKALDRQRKL